MNGLKIAVLIMALSAFWLSAAMIDDMEDGDAQNEIGFYWSYFANGCDSEITVTNAILDERGRLGMLPVAGIGYDEGYAAELSWKINSKPVDCAFDRLVSLVTSLCFDSDDGSDWQNATEISFYARAHASITARVQLTTAGAPNYGYYYKDIEVTPEWNRYIVKFTDLTQYESAAKVEFVSAAITKIQFNIMADLEGTPDSGSLFIDDIEVDDTIISTVVKLFDVLPLEPGRVNEIQGTLLSDFEGGNQGEPFEPAKTNFKTGWYVFNDSETAGVNNSIFTDGIQINPQDLTETPQINVGGKGGFDSSQCMKVSFKLGNPIRDGEAVTQPFVGIGCMLSNAEEYLSGIDSSLKATDASEATGLYFDYKTVATNDKFNYFNFELYDTDSLPDGISYHIKIPVTKGVWRGATIPFDDLLFTNLSSEDSDLLTVAQRSLDRQKLDKMQFIFQSIKETEIDIYFDNVKFVGTTCSPYGCEENVVSSANYKKLTSVTYRMCTNGLKVTLNNLPGGKHTTNIELVGINGAVIAREKMLARDSHSQLIKTDRLSAGVYILRVTTRFGNGKKHSFADRVSVFN